MSPRPIYMDHHATTPVDQARAAVADLIRTRGRGDHLVTVTTEHPAVLDSCRRLEQDGWRVTRLPVGDDGLVDPDTVAAALTKLHVSFAGVEGEALLMALGDLAVSTGSACSSGSAEFSHVLAALGVPGPLARASLRFGLGRSNSEADQAIGRVAAVVTRLRG